MGIVPQPQGAPTPPPPMAPQLPAQGMLAPQAAPVPPMAMPAPPPIFHDITIRSTRDLSRARVVGVPPEEFGIERNARSISDANYAFHEITTKTRAELIDEGFDKDDIRALQPYTGNTDLETQQRDTAQEHLIAQTDVNWAAQLVRLTEHYVRMDFEGNGRPQLYQVITGGALGSDSGKILYKDGQPCITPFDQMPFAAATPVPVTHRFFGRSIADLVIQTQREKTALKRGALDNIYLRNNPRVEVPEPACGANTIDDLLVSRPGGIVRTKAAGMINWQVVPDITGTIFPVMQYLDAELESRTGVSKQTQGLDANALQNQSATAVAQVFSASQMRMKLIARILSEGVRDIFSLLHATIRKHGGQAETVQLRNQWISVDPRGWKTRDDMTVNVGLGTGGKAQQFAQTMAIGNVQKELLAGGKSNLVGDTQLYNTAAELTRIMGHRNPNLFFKDPDAIDPQTGQLANPPPQPQPDPKAAAAQAAAQARAQATQASAQARVQTAQAAAQVRAQADAAHQQAQLQANTQQRAAELQAQIEIEREKSNLREREMLLEASLKQATAQQDAAYAADVHRTKLARDVLDVIATAHAHDADQSRRQAEHDRLQNGQNNAGEPTYDRPDQAGN